MEQIVKIGIPFVETKWDLQITDPYIHLASKFVKTFSSIASKSFTYNSIILGTRVSKENVAISDRVICKKMFVFEMNVAGKFSITGKMEAFDLDDMELVMRILYLVDNFLTSTKQIAQILNLPKVSHIKSIDEMLVEQPNSTKYVKFSETLKENIRNEALNFYGLERFSGKAECRTAKDVVILYCKFCLNGTYKDIKEILGLTTHPIRRTRELVDILVTKPDEFSKMIKDNPWPNKLSIDTIKTSLNIL